MDICWFQFEVKIVKTYQDVSLGNVYQVVEKEGELIINSDVDEGSVVPPRSGSPVKSTH